MDCKASAEFGRVVWAANLRALSTSQRKKGVIGCDKRFGVVIALGQGP
jgi:hypothetical protein